MLALHPTCPRPERSALDTYIDEVMCREVVTPASGVDETTQGECLLGEERRAWESRGANGQRKEDEPAKTETQQAKQTVLSCRSQKSVPRGKEWSAVPGRLLRKLKTERCLRSSASWRTDVTWADPRPSEGLGQEPSVQ